MDLLLAALGGALVAVIMAGLKAQMRRDVRPLIEIVGAYRRLAKRDAARFAAPLAASLQALSLELNEVGQGLAALEAVQEAVDIYRLLARENQARYAAALGECLSLETALLERLGFEPVEAGRIVGAEHRILAEPRRPLTETIALYGWGIALLYVLLAGGGLIAIAASSGTLPF